MKNLDKIFADCAAEKKDEYPLTPIQMGLYLDYLQHPQSTNYNIPYMYKFKKGDLDNERLIEAIKKAVNNHLGLKVRIENSDGTPVMILRDDFDFDVNVIKTDDPEKEVSEFVKPFNLEKDLLCRAELVESDTECMVLMDIHHIVFDGTSVDVLGNEIALAYDGKELPPEKISMLDVSNYEQYLESTEEYKEAKEYFDGVFSGTDVKSNIPEDFEENTENQNEPNAMIEISSQNKFTPEEVEKFTRKVKSTPGTLFLAAYEYALAKFTGQDEALIFTATHGRVNKCLINTAGMMVHTLPLYAKIDEQSTVKDFLGVTFRNLRNTIKNDIYPFIKVANEHDIVNDTMIVYQSDIFNKLSVGGIDLDFQLLPRTGFKLDIMIYKHGDHFEFHFEYRRDIYKEETIRLFADTYVKIVYEFLNKEKLCEVEFLTDAQKAQLDKFNETEKDYEKTDIVTLFRRQTEQNPDNTAVVYFDKKLTYKEVDEISERIGAYISSIGIGREDVVSILIPRCEYMVTASLGVLKSGAAYQPLDPSYPTERLEFMMQDADAKLLIAGKDLLERVPNYNGKVLLLDDIPSLPQCDKISANPNPEDLFIMLYTSGSTGTPKGCMLEHRNLVSFCNWYRNYYSLTSDSKVAAYASYGFDANMMDMYPALTTGASVYIIDESIRLDLLAIDKYFNENGITHSFMTTQVGRQFALEADCKSLQHLSVGGERLVPVNPQKDFSFYNVYGPTECTIFTTAFPVHKNYDRVPIGKALYNTKLYVVDKYGRRLPPCVPGELWVAGHG
ncbi:MAG: AMP-binding protein, partial [Ruminococcus sp.]